MDHETNDTAPEEATATEEGLQEQSEEIQKEHAAKVEDAPDPRDPDEWRTAPKEGGGA
jgi:hypothetical protein